MAVVADIEKVVRKIDFGGSSNTYVINWLKSGIADKTIANYLRAIRVFVFWSGKTPEQLLKEADEEQKMDRLDPNKKRSWNRLNDFHSWLSAKLSPRNTKQSSLAISSFYAFHDLHFKFNWKDGQVVRRKRAMSVMEVKKLSEYMKTARDKAIVRTIFQGMMDGDTLVSIRYGEIAKGIAENEHPLKLELWRGKTDTGYYTFLGHKAIVVLKEYLEELQQRGVTLKHDDPLSVRYETKTQTVVEPLMVQFIHQIIREGALRAGLMEKEEQTDVVTPPVFF